MEGISAGVAFVSILPNTAGFGTKLDAQMGPQLSKTQSRLSKFKGVAALAFVGAGAAAIKFGADSVAAARDSELATTALQAALSKSPLLIGATTAEFQEQATALQNLTGVSDEEILAADTILARFDLTADQLKATTPLVLDYAQATGKDVPTSASLVAKALLGNTKALKTIGIDYKVTGDKAVDLANIQQLLTDKVGGSAAAFGETSTGKIAIFDQKLDDLKETIGATLIPVLDVVTSALTAILDAFSSLPGPVQKVIIGVTLFGGALVITGLALGVLRKSMRGFVGESVAATTATVTQTVATEGLAVAEGQAALAAGPAGMAGKLGMATGGLKAMLTGSVAATGGTVAFVAAAGAAGFAIGTWIDKTFGISDALSKKLVPALDVSTGWFDQTSGTVNDLKEQLKAGTITVDEFKAGVDRVNEAMGTHFSAEGIISNMEAAAASVDTAHESLWRVRQDLKALRAASLRTITFKVDYNERGFVPVGGGQRHFAEGGVITEPVVGIGTRSGKSYSFAEHGPETVVPHGGVMGGASVAKREGGTWHVTINEAHDPRRVLAELRMERAIRGW